MGRTSVCYIHRAMQKNVIWSQKSLIRQSTALLVHIYGEALLIVPTAIISWKSRTIAMISTNQHRRNESSDAFPARNPWEMFKVDPFPCTYLLLSAAAVAKHLQYDHSRLQMFGYLGNHWMYDGPQYDKLNSPRTEITRKSPKARYQVGKAVALSSESGAETLSEPKYFPFLQVFVAIHSILANTVRLVLGAHTWRDSTALSITGEQLSSCWDVGSALQSKQCVQRPHSPLYLITHTHIHTHATQKIHWLMKELSCS